jgi:4-diphosphocytidyl-2-C-methyl-D-erythritol kinase
LHVTGRRADGFHLLDSLAVFPTAGDVVRAAAADEEISLAVDGPFGAEVPGGEGNLVLRAVRALSANAKNNASGASVSSDPGSSARRGARIVLTKNLPVASGIGGGSADAAATLRLLAQLWGVRLDLHALAERLGADVAVCLASRTARMGGIGERLEPGPVLPECGIALVNPGMPVATADVFRSRRGAFSQEAELPAGWRDAAEMASGLRLLRNDLEEAAIELCPAIKEVLGALRAVPGCLLARVSGSGATCFGLFATADEAAAASASLTKPGWWSWGGALESGVGR